MELILLANTQSFKKNNLLMIFKKNTKTIVCSLDGDTGFFKIDAGILQEET